MVKLVLSQRIRDEFSDYAIKVFNDDKLWNDLRSNLLKIKRAENLE